MFTFDFFQKIHREVIIVVVIVVVVIVVVFNKGPNSVTLQSVKFTKDA